MVKNGNKAVLADREARRVLFEHKLDKFFTQGLIDVFRQFNKEPRQYTWWDYKTAARERNVGWRLDYFMTDAKAAKLIKNAYILGDVYGSDHAPVGIDIAL